MIRIAEHPDALNWLDALALLIGALHLLSHAQTLRRTPLEAIEPIGTLKHPSGDGAVIPTIFRSNGINWFWYRVHPVPDTVLADPLS